MCWIAFIFEVCTLFVIKLQYCISRGIKSFHVLDHCLNKLSYQMLAYLVTELHWFHQMLHVLIDYCFVHCHVCKALVFPTTCCILQLGIQKLLMIISLSLFPENGYWRPYVQGTGRTGSRELLDDEG